MTTTRGRKLVPRTDAERMALLDLLVNGTSTRERKDLELWWDRHELVLSIGAFGKARRELVRGTSLTEVLDRAISKNSALKVGIRQRAKRKRRRIKPTEIPVVVENSTVGEVSCPTA